MDKVVILMPEISQTEKRKIEHLKVCMNQDVEAGRALFDGVILIHNALPDMDFNKIDTSAMFLGKKMLIPIVAAAITGGTGIAGEINRAIARVCQRKGIGMGLGSQRKMIEDEKLMETYQVRKDAPDIFLMGNIGIFQLKEYSAEKIEKAFKAAGADAMCVHFNPGQEVFQAEGDTDFSNTYATLKKFIRDFKHPVICKEAGNGISRDVAIKIKEAGAVAIDVGGVGGTSWIKVDGIRANADTSLFDDWGIPTAASVMECNGILPIIATGGIRNGLDVAKAIVLGADVAGLALPILKAVFKDEEIDEAGLENYIDRIEKELKIAMFLTGSKNITELKKAKYLLKGSLLNWKEQRGL